MERFSKSKSNRETGVVQQPTTMNGLRSYSTSYYIPQTHVGCNNIDTNVKEVKAKKEENKSKIRSNSSKNWSFNLDPELQRKKRVAGYKAYSMEGKMKGSFKKSFRWIKDTCNQVVHGIW